MNFRRRFLRVGSLLSALSLLVLLCISLSACDPIESINGFMNSIFPTDEQKAPADDVVMPDGELRVHFIDVGQADCVLIQSSDAVILVDAGDIDNEATEQMLDYLRSKAITKIDCFVLTHPHADHIGGAPNVLENFDVRSVLMPDCTANTAIFQHTLQAIEESGADVIEAESGSVYTWGAVRMSVLAPNKDSYANTNNYSVAFRLDYGQTSMMLTGDAETASLNEILDTYPPATLNCDVMKAGHHGAENANPERFLSAVSPNIVVISCGADNSYGHPHKETLERLRELDAKVYRTDESGTVVLVSDGHRFSHSAP